MGAKKNPYYRIIVADSKSPRDGRFIEEIGTYNPLTSPSLITVDVERANYWIKNGAQPTDTVRALLKKSGAGVKEVKVKTVTKKVKETPKAKAQPKAPAPAEPKVEVAEPKAEVAEPKVEETPAPVEPEVVEAEVVVEPEVAEEPKEEAKEKTKEEPKSEAKDDAKEEAKPKAKPKAPAQPKAQPKAEVAEVEVAEESTDE